MVGKPAALWGVARGSESVRSSLCEKCKTAGGKGESNAQAGVPFWVSKSSRPGSDLLEEHQQ